LSSQWTGAPAPTGGPSTSTQEINGVPKGSEKAGAEPAALDPPPRTTGNAALARRAAGPG